MRNIQLETTSETLFLRKHLVTTEKSKLLESFPDILIKIAFKLLSATFMCLNLIGCQEHFNVDVLCSHFECFLS